jgi:hypothetical protein
MGVRQDPRAQMRMGIGKVRGGTPADDFDLRLRGPSVAPVASRPKT